MDSLGIEDRLAILDLTIRYAWAIDSRSWSQLDDVFAPDATAELTDPLSSRDAIKERVRRALEPLDASQHFVSNHRVRVHGDSGFCECYVLAQHVRRSTPGSRTYIVGGRYEDRLVRTSQGWRIAHRKLVVDWTEGNPAVLKPT